VVSLADVNQHRLDVAALVGLARRDVGQLVAAVGDDPNRMREAVIRFFPELLSPYMQAAGLLGASLFEALRADSDLGPGLAEPVVGEIGADRVRSLAGWAVEPLVDPTLAASVGSRLGGSVSRFVANASRDTIGANAFAAGGGGVRYQRIPRPNTCAFCGMLASRPSYMSYTSEQSARSVVGTGSTRGRVDAAGNVLVGGIGGGIKPRGLRELGADTHDDCRCVIVPVFSGGSFNETANQVQQEYQRKYQRSLSDEDGNQLSGTKDILSEWRKQHGTR
jgi:hypothetical protein